MNTKIFNKNKQKNVIAFQMGHGIHLNTRNQKIEPKTTWILFEVARYHY